MLNAIHFTLSYSASNLIYYTVEWLLKCFQKHIARIEY